MGALGTGHRDLDTDELFAQVATGVFVEPFLVSQDEVGVDAVLAPGVLPAEGTAVAAEVLSR